MPKKPMKIQKGEKYGFLKVIKEIKAHIEPSGRERRMFLFKCDCGNKTKAQINNVRKGATKSCGCFKINRLITHGSTKKDSLDKKLYHVWFDMQGRCYDESCKSYKNYGGRGIKVCMEWRKNPEGVTNFLCWAKENGYQQGLEIDRKNNDKDYSPKNCHWVSRRSNINNRRKTILAKHPKTKVLTPFSYLFDEFSTSGVTYKATLRRYHVYGWPLMKALTQPYKI